MPIQQPQLHNITLTTTPSTIEETQKKNTFISKLTHNCVEFFRQVNINEYNMNQLYHFEELQYIDDMITPLMYTAHYGYKQLCRHILCNVSIDIDFETTNNKQTALIVACQCANYQIIRLLLLHNAQCNKPNELNYTALTVILFRLLQQPKCFESRKICFLIADLLVHYGADINWIIDKQIGYSLLHYFCNIKIQVIQMENNLNYVIVKWLIQKGANLSLKTLNDRNCKDILRENNHLELIQLVQSYQLKSNSKSIQQSIAKNKKSRIPYGYFSIQS